MYELLIIDDDFAKYDTPDALDCALEKLKKENINWSHHVCNQSNAVDLLTNARFDAILLDNDFGEGIRTLSQILAKKIPIGYISAYDLGGLIMQYNNITRDVEPTDFEKIGITLIQKPGKNISRDIPIGSLRQEIYLFLKEI